MLQSDVDKPSGSQSHHDARPTPQQSPRNDESLPTHEPITASNLERFLGKSKLVKAMPGDISDVKGSVQSMARDQKDGFSRMEA
eukprot:8928810-Karenia_brevis.AAC.1